MKAAGAVVYGISNEEGAELQKMKLNQKLGNVFRLLSDAKGVAAARYAGTYEGRPVLKPATFVIGGGGKVVFGFVEEDSRARPTAGDVVKAVQLAQKQIRAKPPAKRK